MTSIYASLLRPTRAHNNCVPPFTPHNLPGSGFLYVLICFQAWSVSCPPWNKPSSQVWEAACLLDVAHQGWQPHPLEVLQSGAEPVPVDQRPVRADLVLAVGRQPLLPGALRCHKTPGSAFRDLRRKSVSPCPQKAVQSCERGKAALEDILDSNGRVSMDP